MHAAEYAETRMDMGKTPEPLKLPGFFGQVAIQDLRFGSEAQGIGWMRLFAMGIKNAGAKRTLLRRWCARRDLNPHVRNAH